MHRDLKPENVMLTSGNPPVPKLIDFGLAKEVRHEVGSTLNRKGTPEWMAPEQKSQGGCSTASDVYAVGLMAYFLWDGTRPLQAGVLQQATHARANRTLNLMHACVNEEAKHRPAAAVMDHELTTLKDVSNYPAIRPSTMVAPMPMYLHPRQLRGVCPGCGQGVYSDQARSNVSGTYYHVECDAIRPSPMVHPMPMYLHPRQLRGVCPGCRQGVYSDQARSNVSGTYYHTECDAIRHSGIDAPTPMGDIPSRATISHHELLAAAAAAEQKQQEEEKIMQGFKDAKDGDAKRQQVVRVEE